MISIEGSTELAFTEDAAKRFEAYGWHVIEIDGHDHSEIAIAIEESQADKERPSLVICKTKIGFGSPNKEGKASSHGSPLGDDEIKLTKEFYGMNPEKSFYIADEVLEVYRSEVQKGAKAELEWNNKFEEFSSAFSNDAKEFTKWINRDISSAELEAALPVFEVTDKGPATRASSGKVINAIKEVVPSLFGGSADLGPSTVTDIKDYSDYTPETPEGRTIHFGVREFGMAAALNGMAVHGGIVPFGATFFVFTDYLRPALRLSALMKVPAIYVMTHDSIGLGEDGPTHQPVEHLASIRAMPNVTVIRPGDANEVAYAWKVAIENTTGPTVLVLTRQGMPTYERTEGNAASMVSKGAYVLADSDRETPDAILIGTGSELHLAVNAKAELKAKGIDARVVSMPSWELFEQQDAAYKESVLPKSVTNRVSIEAGSTFGWDRYIGTEGTAIGIDSFGESGPAEELYIHFGITTAKMVDAAS